MKIIDGLKLPAFPAAIIAFVLNYAAYFAEIFRGGIQSIDRGQYEGAKVLGMTYVQTMRRIICPRSSSASCRRYRTKRSTSSRIRPWSTSWP
mgnify:CR=1 FL=1